MQRLLALALAALTACGPSSAAQKRPEKRVSGIVWYRERIALPPDAAVQVEAVDGAQVVGRVEIRPQGENPIPWQLGYDPTAVKGQVAFVARVMDGTKVIFESPAPVPPADLVRILVQRPPEPKRKVTGQVVWKPDGVPAAGAQCVIRLGDETTVFGETTVPMGEPPIAFDMEYDPTLIDPAHTYTVTARVVVDGKTVLTAPAVGVITQGKPTDVRVVLLPLVETKPVLGADVAAAVAAYLKTVPPRSLTATVDLDGDGDKDGLAWVQAPGGAGTLIVLEGVPGGFRFLARIAGVRRPVWLGKGSTKGWKDLVVTVSAGRRPKLALLPFDGQSYPEDAAHAPATDAKSAAQVLLK
jgi:uncharacterized lipoprotein YbaY